MGRRPAALRAQVQAPVQASACYATPISITATLQDAASPGRIFMLQSPAMQALSESTMRATFGGCSAGERKRLKLPELKAAPWHELDFFAWLDRSNAHTGYLVGLDSSDVARGLVLRAVGHTGGSLKQSMCSLCRTLHLANGVALFSTPKWGEAGKRGDAVGDYICADLACSAYVRRLKRPDVVQMPTLESEEARIIGLRNRVAALIERACG